MGKYCSDPSNIEQPYVEQVHTYVFRVNIPRFPLSAKKKSRRSRVSGQCLSHSLESGYGSAFVTKIEVQRSDTLRDSTITHQTANSLPVSRRTHSRLEVSCDKHIRIRRRREVITVHRRRTQTPHTGTRVLFALLYHPQLGMPVSQHMLWSVFAAQIRTRISTGCAGIANTPSVYRVVCTHVEYPIATLFSPSSRNTHKYDENSADGDREDVSA